MNDQNNIPDQQDPEDGKPPVATIPPINTGHKWFDAGGQATPLVQSSEQVKVEQPVADQPAQEQTPQPDPPVKKLFDYLSNAKLYTKTYPEFQKQFNNPQSIDKLYDYLGPDNSKLYTKSKDEFYKQFFDHLPPKEVTDAHDQIDQILKSPQATAAIDKLTGDQFANDFYEKQANAGAMGKDATRVAQQIPFRLPDQIKDHREDFLAQAGDNPDMLRPVLQEIKRQNVENSSYLPKSIKDKDLNKKIDKSIATIDVTSRPHDPSVLKHNLDQIDKGNLTYNANTKQFEYELGTIPAIVNGFKEHSDALDKYDYLMNHTDDEKIKYFDDKIKSYNPDDPVGKATGFFNSLGSMLGSNAVAFATMGAGGIAGAAAGTLATGGAAAIAATVAAIGALGMGMGIQDFHHTAYANATEQVYRELRQKHPDVDPHVILQEAESQGNISAGLAMAQGLLMGEVGSKLNKGLELTPLKGGAVNVVKALGSNILKKAKAVAPDAITQSGIASGFKAIENHYQGKPLTEGGGDAFMGTMMMMGAFGLLRSSDNNLSNYGKRQLTDLLSKAPEGTIENLANAHVAMETKTPEEAAATVNDIKNFKAANKNAPDLHPISDDAEFILNAVDKEGGNPQHLNRSVLEKAAKDSGIEVKGKEGEKDKSNEELVDAIRRKKNSIKYPDIFTEPDITKGLSPEDKKAYEDDPEAFMKSIAQKHHAGGEDMPKGVSPEMIKEATGKYPQHIIQEEKIPVKEEDAVKPDNKGVGLSKNTFTHTQTTDDLKGVVNTNDDANPEIKNDRLTAEGKKDAASTDMRGYKQIYTSPNDRTLEMTDLAQKDPDAKVEQLDLLRTLDVSHSIEKSMESDIPEESLLNTKEGTAFKKQMEDLAAFKKEHPDAAYVTHNKVDRAQAALEKTDGKWTDETTKEYLRLGEAEKAQKPAETDHSEAINKINADRQKELNSATKPEVRSSDDIKKEVPAKAISDWAKPQGTKLKSEVFSEVRDERQKLIDRFKDLEKAIPCLWS